jgi:hypothetical protein
MIVILFTSLFPAVTGHENAAPGSDKEARLYVMWNDEWMEDDPMTSATDEEVIFNYDAIRGSMYYLGDRLANIQIQVWLNDTDDLANTVCTLQAYGVVSIIDGTDSPGGIWTGGTTKTFNFTIDIGNSGPVEIIYPLTLTIDYDDITSGMNNQQDTFDLGIYISSIFVDNTDDTERDEHDEFPHIHEFDGTFELEEGQTYQEGGFNLTNHANFSISDVEATPYYHYSSDISFSEGYNTALNPGPIDGEGGILYLSWNFDVDAGADDGFHSTEIVLQYLRNDEGETIVESNRPSGLYVAPSTWITGPVGGPTNVADINIMYNMTGTPPDVDLYYTRNTNEPYDWVFIGSDLTPDGSFNIILSTNGSYGWFAVSDNETAPESSTAPEASYYLFDNIPPELVDTDPGNASVNVDSQQEIELTFSEAMKMVNLNYTIEPDPESQWLGGNYQSTFFTIYHDGFLTGTRTWVNITKAEDLAGNNLSSLPYSFYFDVETSSARAIGPTDDLTNDVWVTIRYTFINNPQSVDLYYTTNTSAPYSWIFIDNDDTVDGRYNWLVTEDGSYGWYAVSPNEAAPTNSDPPQASFYVYDGTPPQVMNSYPIDHADDFYVDHDIRITFNEDMDHWSVERAIVITPHHPGTSFRWDDNTLIIDFMDDLDPGEEYRITIETEARDEAGNNLAEPFVLTASPVEEPIDPWIILWTMVIEIIAVALIVLLLLMRKRKRKAAPKVTLVSETDRSEEDIPGGAEDEAVGTMDEEPG